MGREGKARKRGGERRSTWNAGLTAAWVGGWAGELRVRRLRGRGQPGSSCRVGCAAVNGGTWGDPECRRSVSDPKECGFF